MKITKFHCSASGPDYDFIAGPSIDWSIIEEEQCYPNRVYFKLRGKDEFEICDFEEIHPHLAGRVAELVWSQEGLYIRKEFIFQEGVVNRWLVMRGSSFDSKDPKYTIREVCMNCDPFFNPQKVR